MSDHAPAQARRRGARCPSCGARVTSAATWCSLCFTDLAPAPPPPLASAEVAAGATGSADAAGGAAGGAAAASAEVAAGATGSADAAGGAAAASADVAAGATGSADAAGGADAERVAEQLLAELSVSAATTRRPPLGLVATTGGRVAAMLLGTVLVTGLGFGLLTLGGALL